VRCGRTRSNDPPRTARRNTIIRVLVNHEHRHSAIRFVTPAARHAGLDLTLLEKRVNVYEEAKKKHSERWSGETRNWQPVSIVHLNPDQQLAKKDDRKEGDLELKIAA